MKPRLAFAALALALVTATGCGHLSETDLPLPAQHGARFQTVQELRIYGIKRDLRSHAHDYVVLYPTPGIGGPEVVNLGAIPAGTVLEITGLLQQGPKLLSRVHYRVKVFGAGTERLANEDVRLGGIEKLYTGRDAANQPILSKEYFRRI